MKKSRLARQIRVERSIVPRGWHHVSRGHVRERYNLDSSSIRHRFVSRREMSVSHTAVINDRDDLNVVSGSSNEGHTTSRGH